MYTTDRDAFTETLRKLGGVFGKEPDAALVTCYWEALKDLPIETVKRMADQRIKHGKFFPKPAELRPSEEKPRRDSRDDHAFKAAEAACVAFLEEMRRADPEGHRRYVAKARIARLEVVGDRSSVTYAEEMRQLREIAYGHLV